MGKKRRAEEEAKAAAAAAAAAATAAASAKKAKKAPSSSSPSTSSGSDTSSSSGSDSSSSDSGRSTGDRAGGGGAGAGAGAPVPVRVLRDTPSASTPYVAYFANGRLPAFANDGPAAAASDAWKFQVYERPAGPAGGGGAAAAGERFLVSEQRVATLVGRAGGGELAAPGCQYVLGVYDKEHKTLQLVGAGGGQLCRVEAAVNGVNYGHAEGAAHEDAARQAELDANITARRGMATRLVEAFGSTRRKRQLKAREEGTVRADKLLFAAAAEDALAAVNAAAAAEGGTRAEVVAKAAAARNIPPHHLEATEPHRAYPLRELVPEPCLAAVNVGQLLHAVDKPDVLDTVREKNLVPAYVLTRLPLLRTTDERAKKSKARILALLSALLNLVGTGNTLRVPPGGLDELAKKVRVGKREVLEPLLDLFYFRGTGEDGGETWTRDAAKRELQICYCLVLALDAEGWAMAGPQFDELASQLRMSHADLAQRFRELGCVCTSVKGAEYREGKSYTAALLQQSARAGASAKTLADCLPKPKGPPKARGR